MGEVVGTSEVAKVVLGSTLGYPLGMATRSVEPLAMARVHDAQVVAGLIWLSSCGRTEQYRGSVPSHEQWASWTNGVGVPWTSNVIYPISIGSCRILGQNPLSFGVERVPGPRLVI